MESKFKKFRGRSDRGQIFLELILSLTTVVFLIGFTMELALMTKTQRRPLNQIGTYFNQSWNFPGLNKKTNNNHPVSVLEREQTLLKTERNFKMNPRFKKIFKGHNANDID